MVALLAALQRRAQLLVFDAVLGTLERALHSGQLLCLPRLGGSALGGQLKLLQLGCRRQRGRVAVEAASAGLSAAEG